MAARKQEAGPTRNKLSIEGEAMALAAKKASAKAWKEAFTVRRTIMVERNGWLVMVDKTGRVRKKVRRLERVKIPAA